MIPLLREVTNSGIDCSEGGRVGAPSLLAAEVKGFMVVHCTMAKQPDTIKRAMLAAFLMGDICVRRNLAD